MMVRKTLVLLLGCWLLAPAPADAQFAFSADATFRTRYVWRGITRTTRPVVQPAGAIAWQPRGWTVTGGIWANVEPWAPGPRDLSEAGERGGLGELDYWIEAHTRIPRFDLRAGLIWYDVRGRGNILTVGPGSGWDTSELYAAVLYFPAPLTGIGGTVYWDYRTIDGGFATLDAFHHFPLVQISDWIFTFTPVVQAGISLGQAIDRDNVRQLGYFVDDGLAYALGSTALRAANGTWSPYFIATFQYSRDPATRINRLGEVGEPVKSWIDLGVSYTPGSRARAQ